MDKIEAFVRLKSLLFTLSTRRLNLDIPSIAKKCPLKHFKREKLSRLQMKEYS
jgi:hypothetical protein